MGYQVNNYLTLNGESHGYLKMKPNRRPWLWDRLNFEIAVRLTVCSQIFYWVHFSSTKISDFSLFHIHYDCSFAPNATFSWCKFCANEDMVQCKWYQFVQVPVPGWMCVVGEPHKNNLQRSSHCAISSSVVAAFDAIHKNRSCYLRHHSR